MHFREANTQLRPCYSMIRTGYAPLYRMGFAFRNVWNVEGLMHFREANTQLRPCYSMIRTGYAPL